MKNQFFVLKLKISSCREQLSLDAVYTKLILKFLDSILLLTGA
jgi:hypothetical protein